MKKILGLLLVLIALIALIIGLNKLVQPKPDITVDPPITVTDVEIEPESEPEPDPEPITNADVEYFETDYLVLVNKANRIPDDWEEKVQLVSDFDFDGCELLIERETRQKFHELRGDLLREGINIELSSCYRSVSEQQELWDWYSAEYGENYAGNYVTVPGYSEHHTGLAIDICIIKDGVLIDDEYDLLAQTEIFETIHYRMADYGFILRYPEGREDVTGYTYEPWHLRFVGSADVANDIMESNVTLEEYLAQFERRFNYIRTYY